MITIREFTDQVQAGMIQSFLSDNEIHSILADENANSWSGVKMLIPIRLQVPDKQVQRAKELLKRYDNAPVLAKNNDDAV
jgi:hypothetical protein